MRKLGDPRVLGNQTMTGEGNIRQGDVFWIAPELLRPAVDGVAHPHVVIQDDVLNQSRIPTTVVCGLSTNLKRSHEPGNVVLPPGETGLPHTSVAIVSQVSVVEKSSLTACTGRLAGDRVEAILRGLLFLQRTYFNR